MNRKMISIVLAFCMLLSCIAVGGFTASASTADNAVSANADSDSVAANYGLPDKIEDGNILHCFDWKYTDIKSSLASIAAAGFKSIQTSPAQEPDTWGTWFWLYQPKNFYISSGPLGSKSDLQALCTEAHKYGIKVIVDVVANHLTGDHSKIQSDLQASQYWHNDISINWSNPTRYQLINGNAGMPDLNTSNSYVQQVVKNYLNSLKNIGVDGFRFDAAKHIGLPSEGDNFWKMAKSVGLFSYGEILDQPGGNAKTIINEYANYIGVTDIPYSGNITGSIRDGKVNSTSGNYWNALGVPASKVVYFAESHDTFSNKTPDQGEGGWTKNLKQNIIDRSYAVLGAKADSQCLYLSRPNTTVKENITAGVKGSTHFTSTEVASVNKFHNAMVGKGEEITSGNNCYAVCRENGAVIASAKDSNVNVSIPNGNVVPGTYTDKITGNTWTVTDSTISGKVGSTGIAVFYDENPSTNPTVATTASTAATTATTATTATSSFTPNGKVTIGDTNQDGKVTISDATEVQMHVASMKTLSGNAYVAADVSGDSAITIKDATAIQYYLAHNSSQSGNCGNVIGTDPTNPPPVVDTTKVYFKNTANWSPVKAYFWSDSNTNMMTWPGNTMTNEGNGLYSAKIPNGATHVIFTKGDDSGKTPDLDVEPGKMYKDGSWMDVEGGGSSTNPTTPTQGGSQGDTTKVYFRNTANWSPVKAYFWSDSNTNMMTWPGNTMTNEGNGVYSAKIPNGATHVIFTKGDDSGKTADLDVMPGQIYSDGSWSSF